MRIELRDAPGSLAEVAAVIGSHGGNITAIDVQRSGETGHGSGETGHGSGETGHGSGETGRRQTETTQRSGATGQTALEERVVDELAVEFAAPVDIAELRREIGERTGAMLISHQTTVPVDPVLRVARQLGDALGDTPAERADNLCHRIAELLGTPATWVLEGDLAAAYVAGRAAIEVPGVGCVRRSTEGLPTATETLGEDVAVLAISLRDGHGLTTILAARDTVQGFSATEVSRVEAIVEFHQRLADKAPPV